MIPAQEVETLLARVAMGDRLAFKRLHDLTAGLLMATAYRVLQDASLAEDVVQEVFAGLWHKALEAAPTVARNIGWLCVITRNRAIDHARKRPHEVSMHGVTDDGQDYTHDAVSDTPDVFEQLAWEQDSRCLQHCLEQLAPEPRQAILLSYLEGLTHSELADRMKRPLGTIKAWTRRSLLALRECMVGGAA
ncbi:MAG: sigma-70 family RNA polymerase sigma factor [Acidobacteriota bacterium]